MTQIFDTAILKDASLADLTGGNGYSLSTISQLPQLPLGPGPELLPTSGHFDPNAFGPGPVIIPGLGAQSN